MTLLTKISRNSYDLKRGLTLPPRLNRDLAELLGIHFGDGYLGISSSFTYNIYYSFNLKEKSYVLYVKNLLTKLFGIIPSYDEYLPKNCCALRIHSKTLVHYLSHCLDVPIGPKKNLRIPEIIMNNKLYIASFLRGLFDTDGCVVIQKDKGYEYTLIKFCTKHLCFAQDISHCLKMLNIQNYICSKGPKPGSGYDITIRRRLCAERFISLVGSRKRKKWGY